MRAAIPIPASAPAPLAIPLPILVAAFCLIWSSAFAVSKVAMLDCPPLILVAARCLFAGARPRLARRGLAIYAALGVANYSLYLGLGYVGIKLGVSAGLAALISSANPILTAVLAAVLLDEPLSARKVLGLALGVIGVGVIVESRITGGESFVGIDRKS